MEIQDVKICKLPPMRVATALGFGEGPEMLAFDKMKAFAAANDLLVNGQLPITYGFNNPNPSHGSPNYGYEVWLPVPDNIEAQGDIEIIDFSGGLYAVTKFKGVEIIGEVWNSLVVWQERSKYNRGSHQWLEKLLVPPDQPPNELVFELYLPIAEA